MTALEVDIVVRRLARESVQLRVDPAVLDLLQDGGFDPVYGARGLRRTIRRLLIAPVAECVLDARPAGRAPITLRASVSAGSVSVTAVGQS